MPELGFGQKAPGIFWENWEKSKGSEVAEKVRYFRDEYMGSVRSRRTERVVAKASFDAYIGINGKQWDPVALGVLAEQGRPANTFNIIKPNVDKVFGQIVMNPNTINFTPQNQENISTTNVIQSLYEYDYERGNYKKEWSRFTKDLLIHTGVLEMYIDYSNSKLGNVGIRALNRYNDVEFDGYWNSDNIKDCRYIFKSTWLTARQIKDTYRTKSGDIDASIAAYEQIQGMEDWAETKEQLADRSQDFYDTTNNRYRVIEVVYMQRVPKTRHYDKKIKKFLEDNAKPDLRKIQDQTIIKIESYEDICKMITMAPGVNSGLVLQEGDHPVQAGRLPFFVASADNTMGDRQGVVTGMIDAQVTLNKRSSMLTGNQITSANGSLIYKESFFKDSSEANRFKKYRTVPGETFRASDDMKLQDGIMAVPQGNMPEGMLQSIDKMEEFIEKYTNSTAAVSGRSEGANESGTLFESKKIQSQVAHVSIAEVLAQADKEIAEAYFYVCKKVYAGPHRQMRNSKNGKLIEVNKRIAENNFDLDEFNNDNAETNATVNRYLAGGDGHIVINEIAKLPYHDVIIKRSELGLDQKQRALSIYAEMQQRSTNPMLKALYEKAMIPLMDIPEEMIEPMQTSSDIWVEFQSAQIMTQIQTMKNNTTQSNIQTQQLVAQTQGPQGEEVQQPGQLPPPQGAREAANAPGQGNLPQGVAQDQTGANNQAQSDF